LAPGLLGMVPALLRPPSGAPGPGIPVVNPGDPW
jgi:hypothetical protein